MIFTVRHCCYANCTELVAKNALTFTTDFHYNGLNLKKELPFNLKLNFKEVNEYFKINAFPALIAGKGKIILGTNLSKKGK